MLLLCPLLLCGSPNYNVNNYRLFFYYISHHKTHLYELFERERERERGGVVEALLLNGSSPHLQV